MLTMVSTLTLPAHAKDKSGVLKATDLLKMKVQGTDGKSLGSIKDLVIDPEEGDIDYAVLDLGDLPGSGINTLRYPGRP
jgi:uncharacterized protein YrrD